MYDCEYSSEDDDMSGCFIIMIPFIIIFVIIFSMLIRIRDEKIIKLKEQGKTVIVRGKVVTNKQYESIKRKYK